MKKFNGFEAYYIIECLEHHTENLEKQVLETEKQGKTSIFAPGYFTMVSKDVIRHIKELTLKKYKETL